MKSKLTSFILCAALSVGIGATALAAPRDQDAVPSHPDSATLYWEAHESLRASQWAKAADQFSELEARLRSDEPQSADAAIYWQAYAHAQGKRMGQAKAQVERLRREFPQSQWLSDAEQMLASSSPRPTSDAEASGDDLVGTALHALLSMPAERATPLLTRVIDGNYSTEEKRRALFVLTQVDPDVGTSKLVELARGRDSELRNHSIQLLGIGGGDTGMAALDRLYQESVDAEVKGRILSAWMAAGNSTAMLNVAGREKDRELKLQAVRLLGAMGADSALDSLLADAGSDAELEQAIIEAFALSGNSARLSAIAKGRGSQASRQTALRSLGIAGDSKNLVSIYPTLDSAELRRSALEGLMITGDSKSLSVLYGQATDREEKRSILRMLTMTGDDSALEAIEQVIADGERK